MTEEERLLLIERAIAVSEGALERLTVRIGLPLWIPEGNRPRFEYANRTPEVVTVLKAVRVVSGLNAALVLLRAGYTTETGVLFRTIDDFIDDIGYVLEGVYNGQSDAHIRFIENFFIFDTRTGEEMLANTRQRPQTSRRRIQAAQGRHYSPENPHRTTQIARVVDNVYSSIVHGSYQSVMELYEGGAERFRVRGMLGTPRILLYRKELANYTHRALNTLAEVAHYLGLTDVFDTLISHRREFEASEAYESSQNAT